MPPRGSATLHRAAPQPASRAPSKKRTSPRKSPQQKRSQATVDLLLSATARVLVKEGFDRASTNRIAEVAGVSIGSLYQYFPSKESLVAALIERHTDEMTGVIFDAMTRIMDQPLRVAAREMVALMLRAHAVNPVLHRVLIEQVPRVGRLDRVHDIEKQITTVVLAYLKSHFEELRPGDPDLAAFIVVQTIEALTHAVVIHQPERLSDERLIEEVTALIVRYLT